MSTHKPTLTPPPSPNLRKIRGSNFLVLETLFLLTFFLYILLEKSDAALAALKSHIYQRRATPFLLLILILCGVNVTLLR